MAWFQNIASLKNYVGKELDSSVAFTSISPFVALAEERYYFARHLYPTFWVDVDSFAPDPKIESAKDIYRRSLAWFTLAMYAESSIRLDENGLSRTESDTKKSAFKYQEVAARKMYEQRGFDALDAFYILIEQDREYWGQIEESEEYAPVRSSMIKSARTFTRAANRIVDRRTFEHLMGLMHDVEESLMRQYFPKQYYTFLYGAIIENTVSTPENILIPILRKAIAACTLKYASEQNAVRFEGDRVFLVETYTDGAVESQKFDPAAVGMNRMFQELQQNAYLRKARQYAFENKGQLPLLWCVADGGDNTDADAWATAVATTDDCSAATSSSKIFVL